MVSQLVQHDGMQKLMAKLAAKEAELRAQGLWVETPIEPPKPSCAFCLDRGEVMLNVPPDDPRYNQRFFCPRCEYGQGLQRDRWQRLLSESKLPDHYEDKTFASWETMPAEQRAGKELGYAAAVAFVYAAPGREWMLRSELMRAAGLHWDGVEHIGHSLIFQSPPGYGKTGLAASIVNALLANDVLPMYTRAQSIIQDILKTYEDGYTGKTRQDIVGGIKTARILVLDEFNLSSISDHTEDVFQEIIRHRHGYALPTIITCNWTQDEVRAGWGVWIADVLLEMSHWIPLGGMKLRQSSPVNAVPARTQHLREVSR